MSLTTPFPEHAIWSRSRTADMFFPRRRGVCYAMCKCVLVSFGDLQQEEEEEGGSTGGKGRDVRVRRQEWQQKVREGGERHRRERE